MWLGKLWKTWRSQLFLLHNLRGLTCPEERTTLLLGAKALVDCVCNSADLGSKLSWNIHIDHRFQNGERIRKGPNVIEISFGARPSLQSLQTTEVELSLSKAMGFARHVLRVSLVPGGPQFNCCWMANRICWMICRWCNRATVALSPLVHFRPFVWVLTFGFLGRVVFLSQWPKRIWKDRLTTDNRRIYMNFIDFHIWLQNHD